MTTPAQTQLVVDASPFAYDWQTSPPFVLKEPKHGMERTETQKGGEIQNSSQGEANYRRRPLALGHICRSVSIVVEVYGG